MESLPQIPFKFTEFKENKDVNKKPTTPKKSKPWYIQIIIMLTLICGIFTLLPLLLLFILGLIALGIIPFCAWQMFSFLKSISTNRRGLKSNANYCRLQLQLEQLKYKK